ncbi:EF-hand domain-containing protein [Rhizobium sp. CG5]|uniref:EF-hand domain-containing protein n=1 Tax=Rhizobium sp. CG5 TaxID=2726076 RepID=UPI00203482C0|nr:EF-hand domain-containing protein [Rhizobium sp. CG5]MCM2474023.1 EF-hand domain-containing protein [Rhizobium sp. CG5]
MTSISSALPTTYTTSISTLDTNGDGVVSAEEQEAGNSNTRTQDPTVESENAASSVASQLTGDMVAMMLNRGDMTSSSEEDMFTSMDTDEDGKVTEAEFVAARPEEVSEEDAASLFASFDEEGTGSLTEAQLTEAQEDMAPPPPPMMMEMSSTGEEGSDSETMSIEDVLAEMKSVIDAYRELASGTEATETETEAV